MDWWLSLTTLDLVNPKKSHKVFKSYVIFVKGYYKDDKSKFQCVLRNWTGPVEGYFQDSDICSI